MLKTICPCPSTACRRYGNCTDCREFHRRTKSPTYCEMIKGTARINASGVNLMDYAACAG